MKYLSYRWLVRLGWLLDLAPGLTWKLQSKVWHEQYMRNIESLHLDEDEMGLGV